MSFHIGWGEVAWLEQRKEGEVPYARDFGDTYTREFKTRRWESRVEGKEGWARFIAPSSCPALDLELQLGVGDGEKR